MLDSGHKFRPVEIECTAKMLACGTTIGGGIHYYCENKQCSHTKVINTSCKCKLCHSCGQKATERWMAIQGEVLPDCQWRHITFTMPDIFWDVFKLNRKLLGKLFTIASDALQTSGKLKKLTIGIFSALHTYGRQLNFNCHIHLSLADIGLTEQGELRPFRFSFKNVQKKWRYGVISLLRHHFSELTLPEELIEKVTDKKSWNKVLDKEYKKTWQVNIAKKTSHKAHTKRYLGSYIKKPPIAGAQLKHYVDESVEIEYLDHNTKTISGKKLTQFELIERILSHVPEKFFKMIRYYGFLSNRLRSRLLPIIYEKLEQTVKPVTAPSYAAMLKGYVNVDPYQCILCGGRMVFHRFKSGAPLHKLVDGVQKLAKLKRVEV